MAGRGATVRRRCRTLLRRAGGGATLAGMNNVISRAGGVQEVHIIIDTCYGVVRQGEQPLLMSLSHSL